MKTIAFMNLKGGVAKTVSVINTAAILAQAHGKRVLVVDADSQGNTTEFFGADPNRPGMAELLRWQSAEAQDVSRAVNAGSIRLIAANDSLMDLDLTTLGQGGADVLCIKRKLAAGKDKPDAFDYVLIDCPPAFNAAAAAALVAADEVVIPIKLDAFSLRGMGNLMRQITNMRKINPALRVGGLLPTMWYNSEQIRGAEQVLRRSGLPVYPHIRRSNAVDAMTFQQQPLILSSPRSGACWDYKAFVAELMKGGAGNG